MHRALTTDSAAAPQAWAFFDVDGTLLRLRSMFAFEEYFLDAEATARRGRWLAVRRACSRFVLRHVLLRLPRATANRLYYARFRGRSAELVAHRAREWARMLLVRADGLFVGPALRELRRLSAAGYSPALVSGSSNEILAPFAAALGVDVVLATELEMRGGVYTGRIRGEQFIGDGKRKSVVAFLARHGGNATCCYAFGDHISDAPLLEAVGHPRAVAPCPDLRALAEQRGWPIIEGS